MKIHYPDNHLNSNDDKRTVERQLGRFFIAYSAGLFKDAFRFPWSNLGAVRKLRKHFFDYF